jgi:hypothetical protein
MTTDAGNAAAPEDRATEEAAGGRPGLESSDPGSADSATTSERTADRGMEGSADAEDSIYNESSGVDEAGTDSAASDELGTRGADPDESGFLGGMLREAIVTGLPGETGAPPAEPHAPQAQQEGDEPVGAEPPRGDNPHGVD